MLVIRDEQFRVLSQALFERWMETHLREHFPDESAQFGGAELQGLIQRALKRARGYGFVQEADMCRFVDLCLLFGAEFDTDSRFPWASAILQNIAFKDPKTQIEMLMAGAFEHLRQLEQPDPVAVEDDQFEQPDPDDEADETEDEEEIDDEEGAGGATAKVEL